MLRKKINYPRLLRTILREKDTILVPGAYDAIGAKIFSQAGFEVIYMSGSAVSFSLLGLPDVGLVTLTEMAGRAKAMVAAAGRPLICDADTGYGNVLNVIRTVQEYEEAGVAGIHLEDQVSPKRCGHFSGKEVIPADKMAAKIRAACYARQNKDFLLIARTDALSVEGLAGALERSLRYAEAGADMIFCEAPRSGDELEKIARTLEGIPLLVNMVEGGSTPQFSFQELRKMGFKIVLYPTSSVRVAAKSFKALAEHLLRHGDTAGLQEHMVGFEERNEITGYAFIKELEKKFGKDQA